MTNIATALARWLCYVAFAAMLVPLGACSQQLPLPEGVNPQATPRIIVNKERIEIDGHALRLGLSAKEVWKPWVESLGPAKSFSDGRGRRWEERGIVLTVFERSGLPYTDALYVYLRSGDTFERAMAAAFDPGNAPGQPKPFAGYLEIDGVPIGPKMRLEELQRWRAKLGLPRLIPDGMTGYYRTGEDYKWAQHYYFDDDRVLSSVEFM